MIRWLVGAIGLGVVATHALAADPVEIRIGYLGHAGVKSKLSLIEQPADNDGIAGARLAIEDNNTTGKFLNQRFTHKGASAASKLRVAYDAIQSPHDCRELLLIVGSHNAAASRKEYGFDDARE